MAEKFRIDLGFDQLFGSQSIDPDGSTGASKTVVYDTVKQTFYYTGSYGGGGGGGNTGSFTGSFTGSISGAISDVTLKSITNNAQYPIVFADGTELGIDNPAHFHYNPNLNILVVNGTVSSSNFINVGTVAASKITGSFTGSLAGALTGTASHASNTDNATSASFASDAAGLVHTPNISIGTLTNASTVAGSDITGSFTGSLVGDLTGTASFAVSASVEVIKEVSSSIADTIKVSDSAFDAVRPIPFLNGTNVLKDDTDIDLGYNPASHSFTSVHISASATSSGLFGSFRSGSNIGPAEDGTYTDGLFTDFTHETIIGTPIDRFNEVLKALAPSPAPNMSSLGDEETQFTSCSIAFGAANTITGVTNVTAVGTLSALNVSGTFDSTESFNGGQDYRLGVHDGSITNQNISGKLNQASSEDGGNGTTVNFSASAFGDGNVGQLFLYVNTGPEDGGVGTGTPTVSVNLESSNGVISSDNSNATLTVGATSSGFFPQGTAFTNFTHRTGSYVVKAAGQRQGMNFFRVVHTSSTFHRATNYIQFLNNSASSADVVYTSDTGSYVGSGIKYLSGVKYHTGAHITYSGSAINFYQNVVSKNTQAIGVEINGPTNFFEVSALYLSGSTVSSSTGTASSLRARVPQPNQVSLAHRQSLFLSASISGGLAKANYYSLIVDNNDSTEDLVIRTDLDVIPGNRISDGTDIGSKLVKGLLLDARTIANNGSLQTLQSESFVSESYRLITGSYDSQASVTNGANAWDSTQNILSYNGNVGLLVMPRWESGGEETNGGGMLAYPNNGTTVPESGDFDSFANGPSSNVDYSGAGTNNRVYYRYFRNESTNDLASFTLFLRSWSSTIDILSSGSTLQGNDIFLEVKLPGDTGFLDIGGAAQGSTDDLTANGAPGRLGTLTSIGTSATGFVVQTKNAVSGEVVHDDDYIIVKITADSGFIRTIRSIGITDFIA